MAKRVYQTVYQLLDGLELKQSAFGLDAIKPSTHSDKILLKEGTERTKNLAKMQ